MNVEERIIEQRTLEAIRKNLMGQQGKLYLIAKVLGNAITQQSAGGNFLNFDMFNEDPDTIPILEDDATSHDIGYVFNGLSRGLNIEIICKDYEGVIKLTWDGFCYYHEEANVLMKYVPNDKLEKMVDSLFTVVENKVQEEYRRLKKQEIKEAPKLEQEELRRLRDKWGDII
jgi:hypothetical protein